MESTGETLWEVSIATRAGVPDAEALRVENEIRLLAPFLDRHLGVAPPMPRTTRGYWLRTAEDRATVEASAGRLLLDAVAESMAIAPLGDVSLADTTLTVVRKPGVMDPVANSVREALAHLSVATSDVRTFRRFAFPPNTRREVLEVIGSKVLANDAIEQVISGPPQRADFAHAGDYTLKVVTVPIRSLDDAGLERLSREGQLYLDLYEMQAIRGYFADLGRDPTDIELETLAQTWSEHCSHKTLRGPYDFNGQKGSGLLRDTIMKVTRDLARDWCVSVFVDNSGVVKFDEKWNVCVKVETHNHPSAIEPYGGANTGLGGVIRDCLGTGLAAKPICNTDVFCFASPKIPYEDLPAGVLHPARVMRGVVAGVRDYGNRMGIPTVNGAVCFDDRYLGNPLVFCGTIGLLPADKTFGKPRPGDLIVVLGGLTGRDGIHGATFSSGVLHTHSETQSGGAVQIGNPITQKKLMDVLLQARDQGWFNAVTDCGAGGFSSAVGEMGADIGALVELEKAPLKYAGLSYTEIWISESQERMVLAVPSDQWPALAKLAASEDVDAFVLGRFEPTGQLTLTHGGTVVGELPMEFLHDGRPTIERHGDAPAPAASAHRPGPNWTRHAGEVLRRILASPNVASKEWIIRQYDHEVQGGSVVKPLVGVFDDGPSDAAVVAPVLGSRRGIAIGCGIHPRLGDIDAYRMAASAIDEAIRNVVSVGGDPARVALLDNFCWGDARRPEVFGTLCQSAFACRDVALAYGAPFISGKDSLNNEFTADDRRIVIPPTLLITALTIVPDIARAVTMDAKEAGNPIVLVGWTHIDWAGSHFNLVTGSTGGAAPTVDTALGPRIVSAVHRAIQTGHVRACHDLSEGGLAVAAAEMAFAGNLGIHLNLADVPALEPLDETARLFAESNTRFLIEVDADNLSSVLIALDGIPARVVGRVTDVPHLAAAGLDGAIVLREPIDSLRQAWQTALV